MCLEVKHFNCFNELSSDETFVCWDHTKKDVWIRQPPEFAVMSHPLLRKGDSYQDFMSRFSNCIQIVGVRSGESVQRSSYMANNGCMTKKGSSYYLYPIYDWSLNDVWLFLYQKKVEIPAAYQYMWETGRAINQLRISQFFSIDTAVSLDNKGIVQYSETATNTAGTTTYTRDTDYTMDYTAGTITPITGGSMSAATEYEIDYLHYEDGPPTKFCIEYDGTNKRYVFRLDPVPDDTYIGSLLYPATPSDLSASVDPIWGTLEFAIERGGIYYGSLEMIDDAQKRSEHKQNYENAIQALIQMDSEMEPKLMTIPLRLKKSDHKG